MAENNPFKFNIDAIAADLPDFDEIDRRFAEREAWTRKTLQRPEEFEARLDAGEPVTFNLLSLPGWLEVARLACVQHIPAREIHAFPIEDFVNGLDGQRDVLDAHENKIIDALEFGEMLRMEQVAPAEIKRNRSEGQELGNGTFYSEHFGRNILNLAEDRFYSTLRDSAEDHVRAYARPVITPKMIKGHFRGEDGRWPEEYRVYIKDGQITGVSNYYPQINLVPGKHALRMHHAVETAQRMLDFMQDKSISGDNAKYKSGEVGLSATLDFLVDDKNNVLFLEGGPEGLVGAHPCCFLNENGQLKEKDGQHLTGAAFTASGPLFSLEDLRKMAMKDRIFNLSIDYTAGDPESYRGLKLTCDQLTMRFEGKDPQEDWADYLSWAKANQPMIMTTSSVTHFCSDVPGWRFIEDEDGHEVLVAEDRPELDDHIAGPEA